MVIAYMMEILYNFAVKVKNKLILTGCCPNPNYAFLKLWRGQENVFFGPFEALNDNFLKTILK
jgi:hypothetical protein